MKKGVIYLAGTDFSHLTNDELIKGIRASNLPDYIRSKAYGIDVRETLAQMTEMTIQLGVNMGLSPDDALSWARKLQESISQSEFDSWVATLLDGGPSIFMNTLIELQTTYPNGAAGVALVRETDPAKIYVWNGTSWEDFGDYQGIAIKDGTVTTEKLAPKSVSFDKFSDGVELGIVNAPKIISNINDSGYSELVAVYSYGSIGLTSPDVLDSDNRMYTENILYTPVGSIISIFLPSGMSFLRRHYKKNTEFHSGAGDQAYVTSSTTYVSEHPFTRLVFKKIDDSVLTKSDLENVKITINTNIKNEYPQFIWSNTSIDYRTGGMSPNPLRLSTINLIETPVGSEVSLTIPQDIQLIRRYYDAEGNIIANDGDQVYLDGSVDFTSKYPFMRVALKKVDDTEINESDLSGFEIKFSGQYASPIEGKVWASLGDSITNRGTLVPQWSYNEKVVNLTGVNNLNYGLGGSTITAINSSDTNDFVSRYLNMDDSAELITVFGGVNDYMSNIPIGAEGDSTRMTLHGALKILIEGLMDKYPKGHIGFILTPQMSRTHPDLQYNYPTNGSGKTLLDYNNVIADKCEYYGIPYLDLYKEGGINDYNIKETTSTQDQSSPDGVHPSDYGMSLIAPKIADFLLRL